MKTLAGSARFLAKLALLALAVVVATLAPAQDTRRVGADHSELYIAPSPASSTHLSSLFLVVGGGPRTFYVRAKDVTHDPSGVAAFQVKLVYDNDVASMSSIEPDPVWLGFTGRSVLCPDPGPENPAIRPVLPDDPDGLWQATASCNTLGAEGVGAQGSGLLATFTMKPGLAPGSAPLTNLSFVINTTADAAVIPVTVRSSNVTVAHCGDLNGDGVVTAGDIGIMVAHFGLVEGGGGWDPITDLNKDGAITAGDIGIIVLQFGTQCTQ